MISLLKVVMFCALVVLFVSISSVGGSTAYAQAQQQLKTPEGNNDNPDIPAFMHDRINEEVYHRMRNEQINLLRGIPYETSYNPRQRAILEMELQEKKRDSKRSSIASAWSELGPAPIPNGQTTSVSTAVSGRSIAIAVHPTNPNIVYVGTAQGGIYRTLDGGSTWTAIFDAAQSLAVGALALAPSDPTILYVGTGEPNSSCDSYFGVGLYRINSADTSPILNGPINPLVTTGIGGTTAFTGRSISKILVHPTDPATIFVSTYSGIGGIGCNTFSGFVPPMALLGIYRSTNATAATASVAFSKLVVTAAGSLGSDATGNRSIPDMVMEPGNPDGIVCWVNGTTAASDGGIYRSTNALAVTPTFTIVFSTTVSNVRGELAINKVGATVNIVAATGEAATGTGCTTGSGAVRKSTDGGATWSAKLAGGGGFCGGQCFYDIGVALNPADASIILLGGSSNSTCSGVYKRSTNGGATFSASDVGLHADVHAVAIAPSDPSKVYLGSDGGIFKSTDAGASWTSLNTSGFSATQFQSIALHPTDPNFTIGGTQDNGTEWFKPDLTWTRADFGDGGFALIDQNAPDNTSVTMYHTYFNQTSNIIGFGRVTSVASATEGFWSFLGCGGTANGISCTDATLFYAPMTLGPGNPNTLYFGTDRLYRSTNSGITMTVVSQAPFVASTPVSAIGISRQTDNARIVGLRNGKVYATTTGSSTLTDVTGGSFPANYVARAVIDPNDSNKAYVTFAGFGVTAGQHIWKTTSLSGGAGTWTASGTGIPDVPVNAFAIDPSNSSNLFAGTDIGVYYSTDAGASWSPFGTGLPRVAVFDMAIHPVTRVLRIATHGRGMWENNGAPLPIQLASLSGNVIEGNNVKLTWSTISEVNNYGFYIERREEGANTFTTVSDLIPGAGTTLEQQNYDWTDAGLTPGTYQYRLRQVDLDGQYMYSYGVSVVVNTLLSVDNPGSVREYALRQNYPNPFNPSTVIRYELPERSFVKLGVYNTLGQLMRELVSQEQESGVHDVNFDASNLPGGAYYYTVKAGSFTQTKKLVLVR